MTLFLSLRPTLNSAFSPSFLPHLFSLTPPQATKVNIDPEYVAAYSLPGPLAKLTKNFAYLEFLSLRAFPDVPEGGYAPGGSDIGSYCCGTGPTKMDDVEEEPDEEKPEAEAAPEDEKPGEVEA